MIPQRFVQRPIAKKGPAGLASGLTTVKKNSPSRLRFRPPLRLTFRSGLAASTYCLPVRLRPTRAPCSVHTGSYGLAGRRSRGRKTKKTQFAGNRLVDDPPAFRAGSYGRKMGPAGLASGLTTV